MNPVIIDQYGPLPISVTVQWPSSNTVVLAMSGSAFVDKPNTAMSVTATIKDSAVGTLRHFANPAVTHLAFPTSFHPVHGDYGEFTLTLTAAPGTITDSNDRFMVALSTDPYAHGRGPTGGSRASSAPASLIVGTGSPTTRAFPPLPFLEPVPPDLAPPGAGSW